MTWTEQKAQQRELKRAQKFARLMASPAPRAEIVERDNQLALNVATVAIAIEALEAILVEKGILEPDRLMADMAKLAKSKAELPQEGVIPPPAPLVTREID